MGFSSFLPCVLYRAVHDSSVVAAFVVVTAYGFTTALALVRALASARFCLPASLAYCFYSVIYYARIYYGVRVFLSNRDLICFFAPTALAAAPAFAMPVVLAAPTIFLPS